MAPTKPILWQSLLQWGNMPLIFSLILGQYLPIIAGKGCLKAQPVPTAPVPQTREQWGFYVAFSGTSRTPHCGVGTKLHIPRTMSPFFGCFIFNGTPRPQPRYRRHESWPSSLWRLAIFKILYQITARSLGEWPPFSASASAGPAKYERVFMMPCLVHLPKAR